MGTPTLIEKWIIWPVKNWNYRRRLRNFRTFLEEHRMDWGNFALEEILNMYHRHKDEIIRD